MFSVCHRVLVNKTDTSDFFRFDREALMARIHRLNPDASVFFVSAKTGDGFTQWIDWLQDQIERHKQPTR